MRDDSRGQIITFYSYKGGTGRTMALANIACVLAERQRAAKGKGVLMIDWDLEAPGLHRYFRHTAGGKKRGPARTENNYDLEPGLIDLFYELDRLITQQLESRNDQAADPRVSLSTSEKRAHKVIEDVDLEKYTKPTNIDGLSLIKAGRFDSKSPNEYAERVNKFNWEELYKKSPHLIRVLAETLAKEYAYVLIDSRTGVTDISGICTMMLPEKLVMVFTPNFQSLNGCLDQVRRATDYRKESGDLRPLLVFPLASRIEASLADLRRDWRFGNPERDTLPYEPEFRKLFADVYDEEGIVLTKYFDEVQIQHVPRYAYGEEIAVLDEEVGDRFSVRRSYETFTNKLIGDDAPWEGIVSDQGSATGDQVKSGSDAGRWFDHIKSFFIDRKAKLIYVLPLILIALLVPAYSFSRLQAARSVIVSLEVQRASLQQQLEDAKKPLEALKEKDDQIKGLFDQLSEVSKDRDNAKQDAINAQTAQRAAESRANRLQSQLSDCCVR